MISQSVNGNTSYYGYDGLGSTKFLTDTTGKVTDSYQYNAYGEITNKTGSTDNNYLYAGEQFDRSLNQYYLRARYYNQGVGRFTQQDTWQGNRSNPITLNKYLYADARPTYYTDPSGHMSLGGLMSGLEGMTSLMSSASRYANMAMNAYNKLDNVLTILQMTQSVNTAFTQMQLQITNTPKTSQFKDFIDALTSSPP